MYPTQVCERGRASLARMTHSRTTAAHLAFGPAAQDVDSAPVYVQRLHTAEEACIPRLAARRSHLGTAIGHALSILTGDDRSHALGSALAAHGRNVAVAVGEGMEATYYPADPTSGVNLSWDAPRGFDSIGDALDALAPAWNR